MTTPVIYADRLPHTLPDFTRRIWTSVQAREVWEPRMQRITQAWSEIERQSVVEGVRDAALVSLSPIRVGPASLWAAQHGVSLLVLSQVRQAVEYSSSTVAPKQGEAWEYRAAYVQPKAAQAWVDAWMKSDDGALGTLLGYPECCRAFFQRVWMEQKCVDTTWAMVAGEPGGSEAAGRVVTTACDPKNNILLRWLGLRAVPHLPCRLDCVPTREFAAQLLTLGAALGFGQEMMWLREALDWPVEWSALHGIAEIKTPIVKVSTRTDMTAGKYTLRLTGTSYPAEGARGVVFPYKSAAAIRQAAKEPNVRLVSIRETKPEHNGFVSGDAMYAAHGVLKGVLASHPEMPLQFAHTIMDLGCGDGELLARLGRHTFQTPKLYGVEVNAVRVAAAVPKVQVVCGDFLQQPELWPGPYDIVILMPGRLLEVSTAVALRCEELLMRRAKLLLVYAYGDWLLRAGGLAPLVRQTLPQLVDRFDYMRGEGETVAGVIRVG